jgi:ribosomal protein L7/L12
MAKVTLTITHAELLQLASQKYQVAVGNIHVVDEYETNVPGDGPVPMFLQDMVLGYLQKGEKFTAVAKVREETGWSLIDSKNYVDLFKI